MEQNSVHESLWPSGRRSSNGDDTAAFEDKIRMMKKTLQQGMSKFSIQKMHSALMGYFRLMKTNNSSNEATKSHAKHDIKYDNWKSADALFQSLSMFHESDMSNNLIPQQRRVVKYLKHFKTDFGFIRQLKKAFDQSMLSKETILHHTSVGQNSLENSQNVDTNMSQNTIISPPSDSESRRYNGGQEQLGYSTLSSIDGNVSEQARVTEKELLEVSRRWSRLLGCESLSLADFDPESHHEIVHLKGYSDFELLLRLVPDIFAKYYKYIELCKQLHTLVGEAKALQGHPSAQASTPNLTNENDTDYTEDLHCIDKFDVKDTVIDIPKSISEEEHQEHNLELDPSLAQTLTPSLSNNIDENYPNELEPIDKLEINDTANEHSKSASEQTHQEHNLDISNNNESIDNNRKPCQQLMVQNNDENHVDLLSNANAEIIPHNEPTILRANNNDSVRYYDPLHTLMEHKDMFTSNLFIDNMHSLHESENLNQNDRHVSVDKRILEKENELQNYTRELESLQQRENRLFAMSGIWGKLGQNLSDMTAKYNKLKDCRNSTAYNFSFALRGTSSYFALSHKLRSYDGKLKKYQQQLHLLKYQQSVVGEDYMLEMELRPNFIRVINEVQTNIDNTKSEINNLKLEKYTLENKYEFADKYQNFLKMTPEEKWKSFHKRSFLKGKQMSCVVRETFHEMSLPPGGESSLSGRVLPSMPPLTTKLRVSSSANSVTSFRGTRTMRYDRVDWELSPQVLPSVTDDKNSNL